MESQTPEKIVKKIFKSKTHQMVTRGIYYRLKSVCKYSYEHEYSQMVDQYSGNAHSEARQYMGCKKLGDPEQNPCMLIDVLGDGTKVAYCPLFEKFAETGELIANRIVSLETEIKKHESKDRDFETALNHLLEKLQMRLDQSERNEISLSKTSILILETQIGQISSILEMIK